LIETRALVFLCVGGGKQATELECACNIMRNSIPGKGPRPIEYFDEGTQSAQQKNLIDAAAQGTERNLSGRRDSL
jgi:hypothetical protein